MFQLAIIFPSILIFKFKIFLCTAWKITCIDAFSFINFIKK